MRIAVEHAGQRRFGGVGPRLWRGKLARARTERFIRGVLKKVRSGRLQVDRSEAARVMADLKDDSGLLEPLEVAAVELVNVLRPTAAIAWYVSFAALALRAQPALAGSLEQAEPFFPGGLFEQTMHEVRRFYPFTPFLGARVRALARRRRQLRRRRAPRCLDPIRAA